MVGPALAITQIAVIAASCCVRHICMVGGGGGCSCMLLLHPVLTSVDADPDPCTLCPDLCSCMAFGPCACGVSLLSTGAIIPLAQVVVVTSCNLCWWCYIYIIILQLNLMYCTVGCDTRLVESCSYMNTLQGHVKLENTHKNAHNHLIEPVPYVLLMR